VNAAAAAGQSIHEHLGGLARQLPVGGHGLVALDWHSGNRSVLVDHELSSVVVGLSLATKPEEVYLALLESTAFGTRTIVQAFEQHGVPVTEFVVVGGLLKNTFLMQLYARRHPPADQHHHLRAGTGVGVGDPRRGRRPRLPGHSRRREGDGEGRAVGVHARRTARRGLRPPLRGVRAAHDYFGRGTNDVMHRLRAIRRDAVAR
jgi:L-ribulokinase